MFKKKIYYLYYSGKISEGHSVNSVMDFLIKVQKIPKNDLQKITRGEKLLIHTSNSYKEIIKLENELRINGAICALEVKETHALYLKSINFRKIILQLIITLLLTTATTYILIYQPFISFISTFLIALLFIYPIIFEKEKHMMLFHDDEQKKSKIVQKLLNALIAILFIGVSTVNISCPALYYDADKLPLLFLIIFIFIIISSYLFLNSYKISNDAHKSTKNIYYKKSLIIGLSFSVLSSMIYNNSVMLNSAIDCANGDLCGLIQFLNSISLFAFRFLPEPFDKILSEIISLNIITGYIFTTYGIAINSIYIFSKSKDPNIFLWKKFFNK
jgi:hypothetical protein